MIEIWGNGCRIWIPHALPVDPVLNGNADVHVELEDGTLYAGTLYVPENLRAQMLKDEVTGESAGGTYCYDTTMLVIRDFKPETIRVAIEDMIRNGFIQKAFARSIYPKS